MIPLEIATAIQTAMTLPMKTKSEYTMCAANRYDAVAVYF